MKTVAIILALIAVVFPHQATAQSNPYVRANGRIHLANLNRDCEGAPAYSVGWIGFVGGGGAEISAEALKKAHKAFTRFVPDGTTVTVQGRAAFVRANSGAYASDAYFKVVRNYFCRLINVYPEKRTELEAAELRLQNFFANIYTYEERTAAQRAQFELEQRNALLTQSGAILTTAQVTRAVSNGEQPTNPSGFNFNVIMTFQTYMTGRVGTLMSARGCLGTGFASPYAIDTRVLNGLQSLRSNLGLYLSGQGQLAAIPWLGAPRDIFQSPLPPMTNQQITDLVCLNTVAQQLVAQDTPAAPTADPAAPVVAPASSGTPAAPATSATSSGSAPSTPAATTLSANPASSPTHSVAAGNAVSTLSPAWPRGEVPA
ncbi:hypothetical protein [Brevundimonas subvibrioides]|uniref:hypothetical protein n=1 Tax=Brevundimonas subvibrioides TaxID=74313 RepID=UPI0022B52CDE|nr:hypothetical protein [Brevundimonas subvibrioides]